MTGLNTSWCPSSLSMKTSVLWFSLKTFPMPAVHYRSYPLRCTYTMCMLTKRAGKASREPLLSLALCRCRYKSQLFRERLSKKVHAIIPKGIVGGFSSLFYKEICSNGSRGHGRMFASVKGKQQK